MNDSCATIRRYQSFGDVHSPKKLRTVGKRPPICSIPCFSPICVDETNGDYRTRIALLSEIFVQFKFETKELTLRVP